jgi:sugar/nucleoside kinase (ribokinase family)
MRAVPVAVVGNLSLDLVDDGPPRVGGPPYYASRALRALAVPAMVRVKCAPADRPAFEPAFRDVRIEWLRGSSTATYAFSYDGDARTMEVRALGDRWRPDDVDGLDADWVHVGALFRGEFPAETLGALHESGARISLDGQGLVRPAREGPLRLEPEPDLSFLRHVSVLKLSEEEARALVGSLEERALSALGVPEVVVTFGSRGSVVVARRTLVHVPAQPVGETDPTGAGDAFAAAYVVARSRGHAPRRAAERATRVVSRVLAGAAR